MQSNLLARISRHFRFKSIPVLLFALLLTAVPFSRPASASGTPNAELEATLNREPGAADFRDSITMRFFLDCLDGNAKASVTKSSVESDGLKALFIDGSVKKNVGVWMDLGSGLVAQDGIVECKNLDMNTVLTSVPTSALAFATEFYDLSGNSLTIDDAGKAKITAAASTSTSAFIRQSYEMRQVELVTAFTQCFDETNDASKEAVKYGDQMFAYYDNQKSGSVVKVGKWNTSDGEYSCGTIASEIAEDTILYLVENDISTGTLRRNQLSYWNSLVAGGRTEGAMESAQDQITLLLAASPEHMYNCAAVTLPADSLSTDPASAADAVASEMLEPEKWALVYNSTAEQEKAFVDCLVAADSPYRDGIKAILDALALEIAGIDAALDTTRITDEGSGDSAGEADPCLSSDAFLGWAICPMVEMIVDFTEVLQNSIETSLKFNLSDIGTTDEGKDAIRESWGIFRSLATILLIIGFLIALLVKAIKG